MSVAAIRHCGQALGPKIPELDLLLSRGLTRKATGATSTLAIIPCGRWIIISAPTGMALLGFAWLQARLNTMTAPSYSSLHLSALSRSARLHTFSQARLIEHWAAGHAPLFRTACFCEHGVLQGVADTSPLGAASHTTQLRSYESCTKDIAYVEPEHLLQPSPRTPSFLGSNSA
jgi:hypothetical protein